MTVPLIDRDLTGQTLIVTGANTGNVQSCGNFIMSFQCNELGSDFN